MSKSAETEYGAIYNRGDHLGFGRRLGIVEGISGLKPEDPMTSVLYLVPILIAALIYFPVLKATRAGTVGYLLFKAQLVNLKGDRTSIYYSGAV